MKLRLLLLTFLFSALSWGQTPWINEIHYDNNGGDVDEGVEVAIPTGSSCTTIDVVAYNGNGGALYLTVFDIVASSSCSPTTSNGVVFYWIDMSGLQNGDPDGLALVCDGTVIQFLSYEGSFTATNGPANGMTSVDIGVSEDGVTGGFSLQLQGSGGQYSDFTWSTSAIASTSCSVNTGQTITSSGNLITVTQATGGTITPGTTSVADGNDQAFTATADDCYTFTNWVVDGVNAGNASPYTFTNVTANHAITAVYTQDTYSITATAGTNGTI